MNKQVLHTALIALAAFAAMTVIQKQYKIPGIGKFLPGGV